MRKLLFSIVLSAATVSAMTPTLTPTFAGEPIALRDMGSFHIGGLVLETSGKPIKELLLGARRDPAQNDPNGLYQDEQMYMPYVLPDDRKGKNPTLIEH